LQSRSPHFCFQPSDFGRWTQDFGRLPSSFCHLLSPDVRSYPCRSLEIATKLVERFIAGVSRHSPATADVTKPARPSTQEAETNPHQYDGPPRTAEQVAA
jgi:hypothetical protein